MLYTGTVLITIVSGCSDLEANDTGGPGEAEAEEDEAGSEAEEVEEESRSIPSYEIAETDDISLGDVIRLRVQVRPNDPVNELSDDEFLEISRDIVEDITNDQDVNSVTIFFWEDTAEIGTESAYTRVTWAPDGDLSAATTVSAGDYSGHEYDLEHLQEWIEEEEAVEESELPVSDVVSRLEAEEIEVTFAADDYGPLIIETSTPVNEQAIEEEIETIALVYADAYDDGYRAQQLTGRFVDGDTTTHIYEIQNEWIEEYLSGDLPADGYISQVLSMVEEASQ